MGRWSLGNVVQHSQRKIPVSSSSRQITSFSNTMAPGRLWSHRYTLSTDVFMASGACCVLYCTFIGLFFWVMQISSHVKAIDSIYQSTDFQGIRNISFMVKRIKVSVLLSSLLSFFFSEIFRCGALYYVNVISYWNCNMDWDIFVVIVRMSSPVLDIFNLMWTLNKIYLLSILITWLEYNLHLDRLAQDVTVVQRGYRSHSVLTRCR